jgi:peptide/nickel transport system ATP-binding protein
MIRHLPPLDEPLLSVRDLRVTFGSGDRTVHAVNGISYDLARGETLGVVGESGCGKSVSSLALMRLLPKPAARIDAGEVTFDGEEILSLSEESMREIRGNRIAMIFQDPLMTLNPVLRIDEQMVEAIREHADVDKSVARQRAREALVQVGIPSPDQRLNQYPHEFSGGMRQRVAIAIAMLNKPDLIIADEPTTALDVTIQAQILYEMQRLCAASGTALIWITHDLGVVAALADRIAVMYAGRIVETGPTDTVLDCPRHPYTEGLLQSVPGENAPGQRLHQIEGIAPSLTDRPTGCAFRPRCGRALEVCAAEQPALSGMPGGQAWRCFNPIIRSDAA